VPTTATAATTVSTVSPGRAFALGAEIAELAGELLIEAVFEADLDDVAVGCCLGAAAVTATIAAATIAVA